MTQKVLVTGAAGFIGFHLASRLLRDGLQVVGLDNLNSYYDVNLKQARLERLKEHVNFSFQKIDIADRAKMEAIFSEHCFDYVYHLAAQAGVRYSLENPHVYGDSNLVGFINILEGCRHNKVKHLIFASSSSVYGGNTQMPFSEQHRVDRPISLYAATKKANELMAHTYSHLFGLPCTGLRFFTVYGPWGRPDMALFIFTRAIMNGKPIEVFNHGKMRRDFTYIDDIVEGIVQVAQQVPMNPSYAIYNIGNNQPVELLDMIELVEKALGRRAEKKMLEMQPGDVEETYADVSALQAATGFKPSTPLAEGIEKFVLWYNDYYR